MSKFTDSGHEASNNLMKGVEDEHLRGGIKKMWTTLLAQRRSFQQKRSAQRKFESVRSMHSTELKRNLLHSHLSIGSAKPLGSIYFADPETAESYGTENSNDSF